MKLRPRSATAESTWNGMSKSRGTSKYKSSLMDMVTFATCTNVTAACNGAIKN